MSTLAFSRNGTKKIKKIKKQPSCLKLFVATKMTDAPYCLHESNRGLVKFDFEALRDNQIIDAGNVIARVLHTPGHTTDSILGSTEVLC